jgi:hypothetical protein
VHLSDYLTPRSTLITVNYSVMGLQKSLRKSTGRFLGVGWAPFLFVIYENLINSDREEVEERFQKKLNSWKGKMLSTGGRLVLINSVLSSLSIFMLSFFEVPREILKKLDYYRSRFFWQSDGHKKSIDSQDGMLSVLQRTKEGLVFLT